MILEQIGSGGMGAVYAARDPELDRKVAIKVLFLSEDRSEKRTERLLREGRALARLTHPNVVRVFDVGRYEGSVFIAMELIEGPTLRDWLTPMVPWKRRVEVFVDAGRGLAAVHDCGLLHLDFKPSNVMVDSDERVRLADFGLAVGDLDTEPSASVADSAIEPAAIDISRIRGTPDYMAPEQQVGTVTAAADQFAYCVSLYEALCGRHPFGTATTAVERLTSIALGEPRALEVPGLPPRIGEAIMRGLARKPEDRWPGLSELLDTLEGAVDRGRTSRWIAVGGALVVGVGVLTWATDRDPEVECPTAEAKHAQVMSATKSRALDEQVASFEAAHGQLPAGITARLDERVAEWSRAWATACEAVRVVADEDKPEAHRVLDCLGAQQVALEGTVDLLKEATGGTLARGLGIVQALESPTSCTDEDASVPPPPDQRAAIAEVRAELERAKLERLAGRPKEAVAITEAALEDAEEIGHAPLTIQALLASGAVHAALQRGAQAEPLLERAAWLALESGDKRHAVIALITLVGAGRPVDRLEETLEWAERARTLLEDLDDPAAEATLETNLAHALRNVGQVGEAVEHATRAVSLSAKVPEDVDVRDQSDHTLAIALAGVGRLEEAESLAADLVARRTAQLGRLHPKTASSQMVLASIQKQLGRPEQAVEQYEQILESMLLVHGRESRITAGVYNNRGSAYTMLGRYDEAVASYEHAAAIWTELGNLDSSVYAYSGLAGVMWAKGDIPAVHEHASHAWELIVSTPSGQHSLRWKVAKQLALAAKRSDDLPNARKWWKEALDADPPTQLDRAEIHASLVQAADDPDEAASHRKLAEQALEAAEPAPEHAQARIAGVRDVLRNE